MRDDRPLIALFSKVFRLAPKPAAVLYVLFRSEEAMSPMLVAERSGATRQSVKVYMSALRRALDKPIPYAGNHKEDCYYLLPEATRDEIRRRISPELRKLKSLAE